MERLYISKLNWEAFLKEISNNIYNVTNALKKPDLVYISVTYKQ